MGKEERKAKAIQKLAKRMRENSEISPENTEAFKLAQQRTAEQIADSQLQEQKVNTAAASGKEINWAAGPSTKELQRVAGPNADKLGYTLENVDGSFNRYKVNQPEYQENINEVALKLPSGASVENPSTLATKSQSNEAASITPEVVEEKPLTLSDYLAEQRKKLTKDKTDSIKMQKYYALTDALGALGKMGGAVVGGAIGGNVLDSAPNVGEYKPNRGYLDAVERTKKANDRLRELDEKEFQLSYSKEQRDAERAYNEKVRAEDRKFRKEMAEYENQLAEARAEKNYEREKELLEKRAQLQLEHDTKIQQIRNDADVALKNISKEIVELQMSGSGDRGYTGKVEPVMFKDGSTLEIPYQLYEGLKRYFIGKKINGSMVDEEDVHQAIMNNPVIAKTYLRGFGFGLPNEPAKTANSVATKPNVQIGVGENAWPYWSYAENTGSYPANSVEENPPTNIEVVKSNISKWKAQN